MNFKNIFSIILILTLFVTVNLACVSAKEKSQKDLYTVAVIETNKGTMKAVLFTKNAPITTENFIKLAKDDFYKNMIFHRVVPGFVIQTGDPTGTGEGGSGKTIPLEVSMKLKHDKKGMLAMARKADPDSATSQFYITIEPQPGLDGHYAVFGEVYEGLDVIDNIYQGDELKSVQIMDVPKKEVELR